MGKMTAATVRGLREPGRHADGHGLSLLIDRAGRRYWTYRYMLSGRSRTMTLGNADAMTLAEARSAHTDARSLVLKGRDPLAAREAAKAPPPRQHSFGEAAAAYIANHRAGWRGPRVAEQWRQSLADHARKLTDKPVAAITTEDVLKVLLPIWADLPETASRVRSRIELILDAATALGWRQGPNPAMWRGGLKAVLPSKGTLRKTKHYAALDWASAPALMAALRERTTGMGALCLRFLMLTACRSGEARGARWDEIDMVNRVWTIPAGRTKQGRPHRVPLSQPATDILAMLAEVRTESPLVFFGTGSGLRPLADVTLKDALRRLGHGDVTVHGMRSCFRDWCADHGKSAELAEAALAHLPASMVVQAYQRSDLLDARRGLMDAWASFLTAPPAVVIPFKATG
jgi:integrase